MKTRQYNNGDTCSVSANPGSHYTFDGWFENDSIVSSDNPYSFTVSGDRTLEGKFTADSYTITTNASPVSGGSISGGGTYDYGDTCTVEATPNQDYRFATWIDGDGNFLSNDNPFSFPVSGDLTVRAVFGDYIAPPSILITTTGPASFTLTNSNNQTYTWVLDSGDNYYYGDEPGFELDEITEIKRVGANNTTVISADISELTSMTALPREAFDTCKNLESIVLPDSLTNIGEYAFYNCNNLDTITLPNSLTTIEQGAFASCISLTSINLPNSITSIGTLVFSNCRSLTSITLPNSLTTLKSNMFQGSGLTSITIPSSITTWESDVFYNCTSLESITISEGITAIGVGSFDTCESLTSTTLPASLTSIGGWAFYGCISQESITSLATTPPTLGTDVFTDDSGCNIYVPWSADHSVYNSYVSSWSQYAPRIVEDGPDSLKITTNGSTSVILTNSNSQTYTLNLSNGLNEYYGDVSGFALNEITDLTAGDSSSITPPNNKIISIDASDLTSWTRATHHGFADCTSLTSITLPNTITYFAPQLFTGCTSLTSITLPPLIMEIHNGAFYGCTSLTSITVPSGVERIGSTTFYNCTNLASITLSNSLSEIGQQAFQYCSSLTSITLPSTITKIGQRAFYDAGLTSITCLATTPPILGTDTFRTLTNCPIYVPAASLSAYQSAWPQYASRLNAL